MLWKIPWSSTPVIYLALREQIRIPVTSATSMFNPESRDRGLMKHKFILTFLFLGLSGQLAWGEAQQNEARLRQELDKIIKKYWVGQLNPEKVTVTKAGGYSAYLTIKENFDLQKGSTKISLCKGSEMYLNGDEIWHIDTKSPGCKVGDYEAAAGTTITFWESQSNELRSIVIAKAVEERGYTWPANSTLFFDTDENNKLRLYKVELGGDLKGTKYKKGTFVYVGRFIDDTGRRDNELHLFGEDVHL